MAVPQSTSMNDSSVIITRHHTRHAHRGSVKRYADLAVACPMLIGIAPLIGVLWLLVKLTSRGPGFYSQVRTGQFGQPYRIHKLRSMKVDCELQSGPRWATKQDPRVTTIGRVLRKLHLDELPQLWNVIRGDMSMVGPRPERPEFVDMLQREIEHYSERHQVRPGVTGLAQIQLPADSDLESVRRKLVLDRHYVQHRSLWLDLRIMFGTGVYLSGVSYAGVRRMLRLPNPLASDLRTRSSDPETVQRPKPITPSEVLLGEMVTSDDDSAVYGTA